MSQLTFDSTSEHDTDQFASACAATVFGGLTIALSGELGSGKTRFVRAFCAALGVPPGNVSSPTFVLMQLYQGEHWAISHFDTYRLADVDEFLALGAEDYLLDPERVCLVEWADRIAEILPADHLSIDIQQTGAEQRRFVLTSQGPRTEQMLAGLRTS